MQNYTSTKSEHGVAFMKHKKLIITAIVIFSLAVFLSIFITLWFWGDSYPDFSSGDFNTVKTRSGEALDIPGLEDGAVPQGIANYTYVDTDEEITKQEYFFISVYMKKGPSRLYVTGARTGYVGYVTLKNKDGTDYYGHAGGVATNCNNSDNDGNKTRVANGTLWVVSDGTVYCAKSSEEYADAKYNIAEEVILKAKKTEGDKSVKFTASFKAYNEASFCFFYDNGTSSTSEDKLYVGEFYRAGDDRYSTAKNHHVKTLSGNKQYAFVYEYTSNTTSSNEYGLSKLSDTDVPDENNVPKIDKIISIPDKIQGFARTASGQLVLSESYGLPNSHLYYYDWSVILENTSTNRASFSTLTGSNFEYEGVYRKSGVKYTDSTLYVYFADKSRALRDYEVPCMAEGMCVNGDKIYVLFESGCYKYKAFVRQQIRDIYFFTPREKN